MTSLGQLQIEFSANFDTLNRQIERAKADSLKFAKEIERNYQISLDFNTQELVKSAKSAGATAGRSFTDSFNSNLKLKISTTGITIDNSRFKTAGRNAALGLSQGIDQESASIRKAASKMSGILIDETRSKLKIKSPSQVFKSIGEDAIRGLQAGLGSFTDAAIFGTLNQLIDRGLDTIRSTISAGLSFTGESITKYADLQSIKNQLNLIENSTDSLSFVRKEANRLSLSIDVAQKSFVQLAASAKGTSLAGKETKELFSAVSEAARVYGLSNEQYEGTVLALSQIISKGTVQSEELRGQLAERLPGSFNIAARAIGVTTAQLGKLLETGQLTANEFLPRFAQQLRTELAGGVTGASETSQASISKLQNKILGLQESLGEAISPAVLAGLSFASATLQSFSDSNAFDDLNKSAKDFRDYLAQNPQLAKSLGEQLGGLAKDAISALNSQAKSLLGYLKEHPSAIKESIKYMAEFANSIGRALDYALKLVKPLADAASFITSTEGKLQQAQQDVAKGGNGGLKDVNDTNPIMREAIKLSQRFGLNMDIGDRTGQAASTPTISKPIQLLGDPNKQHHGGNAYRTEFIDGRRETFRAGTGLLTKDLILPANSPIPAPIGGIVRKRTDDPNGYGLYVDIENAAGKLLARMAHFSKFADIQNGQVVQPGQIVGFQGKTGRASGPHLHLELPKEVFQEYVQSLKSGNYSGLPRVVSPTSPALPVTQQQRSQVAQPSGGIATVDQNLGWKTATVSHYGDGDGFDGRKTASGSTFRKNENTVAHKTLPFGTQVEFKGPGGQTQIATVTDRGPFVGNREYDLSSGLAGRLGVKDAGVANIQYRVLGQGQGQGLGQQTQNTNPKSKVVMKRTGQKDGNGLEKIALTVYDANGRATEFTVNSGSPETQGMFGAGSAKPDVKAPLQYGTYNIGKEVAGTKPGVGATFIPTDPTFQTERTDIGFHQDADRSLIPGSAGCIVFATKEEFNKFKQTLKGSKASQLKFEEGVVSASSGSLSNFATQEQPATVKASLEGIKLREKQERDLRLRKSGEELSSYTNRTNNLSYESVKNPSIDQRNEKVIADIQAKYDAEITNLKNSIQDAKSRVGINKNNLSAGNLSEDATKAINEQITLDNKLIDSNTKNLNQLQAAKANALQDLQSSQNNEAQYHAQLQEFNLRENGLKQLQEQIGYFKQLNQNDPNDEIALRLPDLQKEYDIKQAGLDLDKQIVDIRQKVIKGELSADEGNKQITALDEYNQYQEHRINLEYSAAKSAATLQIAQKNLGQSLRESSDYLQQLQRDLQKSQLGLGGNAIALQKEIGSLSSQNTYDQGLLGLSGEKLDPREKERRLQQLDQQMADEALINEAQARKSGRSRELSSSQTVLSSYKNLFDEMGGNDKKTSKSLQQAQLQIDFESQLSQLSELRDTGELTAEQFGIVTKNLEEMNKVKLDKLNGQFDILKEPLNDLKEFGQTALKDLITGSKSLSDVLSDLASNLASTLAEAAASSIFSDLFGSKGGGLLGGSSSGSSGLGSLITGLLGFSAGGIIPAYASGGLIGSGSLADQLQDESSKTGRKARLVIASEGERILSHRETAIWERLNRPIAAFSTGGTVGSGSSSSTNNSVNVAINIPSNDSKNGGGYTPEQTAAFKQAVEAVVLRSLAPGGALYSRGK